jgi:capsular polysaccharide biosynthesis protein
VSGGDGHDDRDPGVHRYLAFARRRWPVVALVTIAVTAVALAIGLSEDTEYEASASVLITRYDVAGQLAGVSGFAFNQPGERLLATQAQLARVPEVAERAVAEVDEPRPSGGQLLGSSSVTPATNADLLRFAVRADEPRTAVALANAYATAFTRFRSSLDEAAIQRLIADVEDQVAELDPETQGPMVTALRQRLGQLRVARALQTQNATVVRPATGAATIEPNSWEVAGAGVALGLVLGVGLALLLEALDTRARTGSDIARLLGLPILGVFPHRRRRARSRLVMLGPADDEAAEPVRLLRLAVEAARDPAERSLMVAAPPPPSGAAPALAGDLALALARGGRRTVLVDLDLRRSPLDGLFGVEPQPGLTDVISGGVGLDEALVRVWPDEPRLTDVTDRQHRDRAWLALLTSGSRVPSVSELLDSTELGALLVRLGEGADLVVVNGAALGTSDALAVSGKVDAFLVVASAGQTRRPVLAQVGRQLEASPARALGVVVLGAKPEPDAPSGSPGRRPSTERAGMNELASDLDRESVGTTGERMR